ncbi:MAG TPA: alkaline phosphatase D family protein, partial [Microthrixaceae bacterium]|nr:alkaline phosphatase D family protein [Microthrixaceae bacterium]
MDRRQLLVSMTLAGVTAACASSSDGDESGSNKPNKSDKQVEPLVAAEPATAELAAAAFPLGVASGDPLSDKVMLWTRVFPTGTAAEGPVEVAFDVATDAEFKNLVVSDIAVAKPELAHSVHVDVSGLKPDTWYYYRFRAGEQASATAQTRTFPAAAADAEKFKFVFASCQDFQWGQYGAWARAAEIEDLDAVVFLGDYIYETNMGDLSPDQSGARVLDTPETTTLAHYRDRYAQTKADKSLQAIHHKAPWIATFDDHEVSDNYAGDVGGSDIKEPRSRDRRLAAYQAWYEHTPIRLASPPAGSSPENFSELIVNRGFEFGSLASLFMIETRQNADVPPCRTSTGFTADDGPACEEMFADDRTNLGEAQEKWLHGAIADSETKWNILGNPVMLAGLNIGTAETPTFYRDMWDGYRASRDRLLKTITGSKVSNPVTVTGDWHASFVLDVLAEPHNQSSAPVMPEFVVTSISTILFPADHSAVNPHQRYFNPEYGFALATVTSEKFECEFHYIKDVWDPNSPISHV